MFRISIIFCIIFASAATAVACLWDYDTLRDERRGLPGIAEVLAGKWEKHSEFFYRDRIDRMNKLLEREPDNLDAWDNLAVAYEKVGEFDRAIEIILKKDQLAPGKYTTHANLGTFYLHKGDFENDIRHIEKALAINPEAHFGREEYQLMLAKFFRDAQSNPRLLEEQNFLGVQVDEDARATHGALSRGPVSITGLGLKENAIDGIVGMIRFGTGRSAELYFMLGELLAYRSDKHLAYRAYLRAIELQHPRTEAIRGFMDELRSGVESNREFDPDLIQRERAEAKAWVEAYQQFEDDLIRAGKDPDDESLLAPFYKIHGNAQMATHFSIRDFLPRTPGEKIGAALWGAGLVTAIIVLVIVRRLLRRILAARRSVGAIP